MIHKNGLAMYWSVFVAVFIYVDICICDTVVSAEVLLKIQVCQAVMAYHWVSVTNISKKHSAVLTPEALKKRALESFKKLAKPNPVT
jgi:hypothetical protein